MPTRQEQREATRARILKAAVTVFTDKGFNGASTRDIARAADTNQGLITYYFSSKESLWQAAADELFKTLDNRLQAKLSGELAELRATDSRQYAREFIKEYVRFVAEYPELFRMMVDEGKIADERMDWLVDTHIKPRFETLKSTLTDASSLSEQEVSHLFYIAAGAASLIFAVGPECRRLTGIDPKQDASIETHAKLVAELLIPEER